MFRYNKITFQGNKNSDLDLIIIFDKLPNAYREAYIYHPQSILKIEHDFQDEARGVYLEVNEQAEIDQNQGVIFERQRGWPVDAFIHDFETLEYFFQQVDKATYILALPTMVAEGVIVVGGAEAQGLQLKAKEITNSKTKKQISIEKGGYTIYLEK